MLDTWKDHCPYCGEPIELVIDQYLLDQMGYGDDYTEDCQVCCQPIRVSVQAEDGFNIVLRREDDV